MEKVEDILKVLEQVHARARFLRWSLTQEKKELLKKLDGKRNLLQKALRKVFGKKICYMVQEDEFAQKAQLLRLMIRCIAEREAGSRNRPDREFASTEKDTLLDTCNGEDLQEMMWSSSGAVVERLDLLYQNMDNACQELENEVNFLREEAKVLRKKPKREKNNKFIFHSYTTEFSKFKEHMDMLKPVFGIPICGPIEDDLITLDAAFQNTKEK